MTTTLARLRKDDLIDELTGTNNEVTLSNKLSGKVALVTGASKGIGASIALHLAAEGAAVVANYSSSKAGADRVVGEITGNGGTAVAVQANVDPRRLRTGKGPWREPGRRRRRPGGLMAAGIRALAAGS